jgi:DNA polymerase III epsilon subunit-like protein
MFETVRGVAVDERHAIAIDCEMGVSTRGEVELIQIAAVDFFTGEVLLDSLVWPDVKMRHLQTRHSGVTWKMINAAARTKTCLWGRNAARGRLLQFVGPDTVIITHAGKNDLMALRWIHPWIVDTMELEKRRMGRVTQAWRRPSLLNLAKRHLDRDIQQNVGHDCLEDCITTRDLAVFYMKVLPADDKISDQQKFLLRIGELEDPRETLFKDTCTLQDTLDEDTRTWEELQSTPAGENARVREVSVREDTSTWEDDREDDTRPGEDTHTWEHMGDHFGYYLTKEEAAEGKLPALYWPPTMVATPKDEDPVTPGNEAVIDCLDLSSVNAAFDLETPASWKSLASISPEGKAKPFVTLGCDGAGAPKSASSNLGTPALSQGPCETLISSGKAPTSPVIKYFGDNWDVKAPPIGDSWGSAHIPPKFDAPVTHKVKVLATPRDSASVTTRKPPVITLKEDPEAITKRAAYIQNDTVLH